MTELIELLLLLNAPFILVLGAAAGADLGLTLVILALAPALGWPEPPGALVDMQSPTVIIAAFTMYLVEWTMERYAWAFSLWHTFHRWVRVLAIGLLCFMALYEFPGLPQFLLGGLATMVGAAVYMGTSGWASILILREVPDRSRQVASVATDVAFGALLILALEEPAQALAGTAALLLVAAPKLPMTLRAHQAVVGAGQGWLHRFRLPGQWTPGDKLPGSVLAALGDAVAGLGSAMRGAPARFLGADVRSGWMVVGAGQAWFVEERGNAVPLNSVPGTSARVGRLQVRKPVVGGVTQGELLVSRDGPQKEDLDREIP